MKRKITYSKVGDNYDTKDPIKKLAQLAALKTSKNLKKRGFEEISDSRGESAFVWKLDKGRNANPKFMATVLESLGTKNLVADAMRKITGKTYYDVVAHDTVASIVNDLITVGAKPLVVHAFWAIESNKWLADNQRMADLVSGWRDAVDIAGATWGGGETPTLKGILKPNTIDLGGSAVGIIESEDRLITEKSLREGNRILLLKSNGMNTNGISLVRAVARKLKKGYATRLPSGDLFGEAVLTKSNIYAKLIEILLDNKINIHYISNITGHGFRKIMRAKSGFTYILERIFDPQEVFAFIQKEANLSDRDMYQTFNMGMDYALFLPEDNVEKAKKIISSEGFESIDAGFIERGERKLIINPRNIEFSGSSLDLRLG